MAYCAIDDVRALNPKRTYDASSKPTSTQVEAFIDNAANEMDTVLSARGLAVPVAAPTHFVDHLKHVNANGAAATAEMAMFPEAVGTPGGSPHGQQLYRIYRSQLTQLEKGELPVSVDGKASPQGFFERHPTDEPTEEPEWRRPKFGKNKEF